MIKKFVFRCDANENIGLGHLIRSLSIADHIKGHIIFASESDPSNKLITRKGYDVLIKKEEELEEDFLKRINVLKPDFIIFDKKYEYKKDSMQKIKSLGCKIILIDNIFKGMDECDEIIFPNAHFQLKRLHGFMSSPMIKRVKTGLEYVIIRDDILLMKKKLDKIKNVNTKKLSDPVLNIGITTGGSDPEGVLIKIAEILNQLCIEARFKLFYGSSFKHKKKMYSIQENLSRNMYFLPYSIQELCGCDIVICTFGGTLYEMIYLGIPSLCVSHSIHNAQCAKILVEKLPIFADLGYYEDLNSRDLIKKFADINIYKLNENGIIDGDGAKRIANLVLNQL